MAGKINLHLPKRYHLGCEKVSRVINSQDFDVDYCPKCGIFIYKNSRSEEMEVGVQHISRMIKQIESDHGENTEIAILKYLTKLSASKSDEKRRQAAP
jgi:hypothetical protein